MPDTLFDWPLPLALSMRLRKINIFFVPLAMISSGGNSK